MKKIIVYRDRVNIVMMFLVAISTLIVYVCEKAGLKSSTGENLSLFICGIVINVNIVLDIAILICLKVLGIKKESCYRDNVDRKVKRAGFWTFVLVLLISLIAGFFGYKGEVVSETILALECAIFTTVSIWDMFRWSKRSNGIARIQKN